MVTADMVFRDPYILDFPGLKDAYAEKDLEAAILRAAKKSKPTQARMPVPLKFLWGRMVPAADWQSACC